MKNIVGEYDDPQLVTIYDTLNPVSQDTNFYEDLVNDISPKRVIDLGCGTGLLTCMLTNSNRNVIGVEPSQAMLEIAKDRKDGELVTWVHGDSTNFKDEKEKVDLVIMTGHVAQVFVDSDSWLATLKNIHNILQPNGILAFESRNPLLEPWKGWTKEESQRDVLDPIYGKVIIWHELASVDNNVVSFENKYVFEKTNNELTVKTQLCFRSKEEIERTLVESGFVVDYYYGDWDKSELKSNSKEIIVIARRL